MINTIKDVVKIYSNEINWEELSWKHELSEKFIEDFLHFVDWYWISKYQKLSKEFLIKYIDKIETVSLKSNEKISTEIKEEIMILKKLTQ